MQCIEEDSDLDFQPLLIKELANKTTTIIKYIQKQKKSNKHSYCVIQNSLLFVTGSHKVRDWKSVLEILTSLYRRISEILWVPLQTTTIKYFFTVYAEPLADRITKEGHLLWCVLHTMSYCCVVTAVCWYNGFLSALSTLVLKILIEHHHVPESL